MDAEILRRAILVALESVERWRAEDLAEAIGEERFELVTIGDYLAVNVEGFRLCAVHRDILGI